MLPLWRDIPLGEYSALARRARSRSAMRHVSFKVRRTGDATGCAGWRGRNGGPGSALMSSGPNALAAEAAHDEIDPDEVCTVSERQNAPGQVVVSDTAGRWIEHQKSLERVGRGRYSSRSVPPFHSPLMVPPPRSMQQALGQVVCARL